MRPRTILPLTLVGAVAVTAMALYWRVGEADSRTPLAAQAKPPVANSVPAARSAAVMVAQDPLHALLTEQTRVQEERARFLDALDAAYRVEPIDATWASAAERALIDVAQSTPLAETGITPDAWSTQCRSHSCKVTAVFGDYDDAQDWANYFLTGTGGTLAQAELSIQRGADSATHVLIFGARR